ADAKARFDAGTWPLELLPPVLDAPRERQVETGDKLVHAGIRTAAGASRRANKAATERDPWTRRMNPRTLLKVAEHLDLNASALTTKSRNDVALVSLALRLAAGGPKAATILDSMPTAIAEEIRKARASRRTWTSARTQK